MSFDAATGRLLVYGNSAGLSIYDSETLALLARRPAPELDGADAVILRCGADRVATLARGFQLIAARYQTVQLHRLDAFPAADLGLKATATTGPRLTGERLEFQLTITNRGPATATNTVVRLQIPAATLSIEASTGTVDLAPGETAHAWQLPRLSQGQTATLRWAGSATNTYDGQLRFTALAESETEDPILGDNEAMAAVEVIADNDRDGLPDHWEIAHGLDPASAADLTADFDGDGYDNATEWFAGTSPSDPADAPRLLVEPDAGDLRLTFRAMPGRTYQVESRPEVSDSSWQPAGSPQSGQGQTVSFTVPPPVGGTAYWRLVIR